LPIAALIALPSLLPIGAAPADALGAQIRLGSAAITLPSGSAIQGGVDDGASVTGEVALASTQATALAAYAGAVATPGNPDFRHFLSPSQFSQDFGASDTTLSTTVDWLTSAGLSNITVDPDHLFVHFTAPARSVENALGLTLDHVKLTNGALGIAPVGIPLVPAILAPEIRGILGLDTVNKPHSFLLHPSAAQQATLGAPATGTGASPHVAASPQALSPCPGADTLSAHGAMTAQQLSGLYGLDPLYAQGRLGSGVTVAVVELEPYWPSDLTSYFGCYGIDPSVRNVNVDGGPGAGPGSGEAALDIEMAASLSPQSTIAVYQGVAAAEATDASMLDIFQKIAQDDVAKVVSTSWGQCESSANPGLINAENTVFEQMATQGQSVFAASGDAGSEGCFISSNAADMSLTVDDPSAQPFVTGVGGVSTVPVGSAYGQTAWNDCSGEAFARCADAAIGGAGGGGTSSVWGKPNWQSNVAANVSQRAVPDVSASADPLYGTPIIWDGGWTRLGGTSAAAPIWAATTALVDQGCAAPAGFLNPALYANTSGTTDVAGGNNDYTNTNNGSYEAISGYDMATGLGVPNATGLMASLESSSCPSVSSLSVASGPSNGGTLVAISGSNLAGTTAVHFGTTAAAFTPYPNGEIVATSPAGAPGTVPVVLTTPSGITAGTSVAEFTYTGAISPPVVTAINPNGAPLTGRPTVDVSGSGFSGATSVFVGNAPTTFSIQSDSSMVISAPAVSDPQVVDVRVVGPGGTSARSSGDLLYYDSFVSLSYVHGYTAASADGNVYALGEAPFFGSMHGTVLNSPIVGMATTPSQGGYWLDGADGGIFSFGDAQFFGSMGGHRLNKPIVGMAATPDGRGYWEVASDGGIFAFGDAQFFGSTGSINLNRPIVGMAVTPDGQGYWEVASDGGVFTFGDAQFYGSTGSIHLNQPIETMAAMPDGKGYWMMASDGGIFAFGDAPFFGSAAGRGGTWTAIAVVPQGVGYLLMSQSGAAVTFGTGFYVFGSGWGTFNPTSRLVGMNFYITGSLS
jgi:hypothetical protein